MKVMDKNTRVSGSVVLPMFALILEVVMQRIAQGMCLQRSHTWTAC